MIREGDIQVKEIINHEPNIIHGYLSRDLQKLHGIYFLWTSIYLRAICRLFSRIFQMLSDQNCSGYFDTINLARITKRLTCKIQKSFVSGIMVEDFNFWNNSQFKNHFPSIWTFCSYVITPYILQSIPISYVYTQCSLWDKTIHETFMNLLVRVYKKLDNVYIHRS